MVGYSEILEQKAYEKFIFLSTKLTEELIPVMLKVQSLLAPQFDDRFPSPPSH